jgi:hypothetical protein
LLRRKENIPRMCEEISVCYKCGHSERLSSACIKEPKSISEKGVERFGGLKNLLWCPIDNYSIGCRRLCPYCRKERRGEMRDEETFGEDWNLKLFLERWNAWKSKEGEEAREERKRQEGEMRRWRERLLEPGW